jgi:hypothetical protein
VPLAITGLTGTTVIDFKIALVTVKAVVPVFSLELGGYACGADSYPGGDPLGARRVTDVRNRGFRGTPGRGRGDIFGLFILEKGGSV